MKISAITTQRSSSSSKNKDDIIQISPSTLKRFHNGVVLTDPGTEKARKELEERLEKRKAEKKETEERLEKQRAEKQEQEERQYNLKIDGKDVDDLTGKMVELLGTSTSIGVMENGVSTFDVLA